MFGFWVLQQFVFRFQLTSGFPFTHTPYYPWSLLCWSTVHMLIAVIRGANAPGLSAPEHVRERYS